VAGDGLGLGMAFAVGIGLGSLFFGGLWMTVRRIPKARWPACLALGSVWGRSIVCVAGFYLIMEGGWVRLAACFLGFLGARLALVRHWRPQHPPVAAVSPRGEPR
jgi:F1F0 ATPase subunit 2